MNIASYFGKEKFVGWTTTANTAYENIDVENEKI
jgi:hypothetical protein